MIGEQFDLELAMDAMRTANDTDGQPDGGEIRRRFWPGGFNQ
jgi:hypothetical protein